MSQYTVPKRKNPLDGTDGFSTAADKPAGASAHIPGFVANVPWYLRQDDSSAAAGTMDHQKSERKSVHLESSESAVVKGSVGDVKTKFVRGACENCGSTSHKRRDCLERPRKVIAKFSQRNLASDDTRDAGKDRESFEAKRDRWRGFEVDAVVGPDRVVSERARIGQRSLMMTEEETFATSTSLRAREDTVKYLVNIDKESAFYDPKSRSMRDTSGFEKAADATQEEAARMRRRFAWDAGNVNEVANPTAAVRTIQGDQKLAAIKRSELMSKYAQDTSQE